MSENMPNVSSRKRLSTLPINSSKEKKPTTNENLNMLSVHEKLKGQDENTRENESFLSVDSELLDFETNYHDESAKLAEDSGSEMQSNETEMGLIQRSDENCRKKRSISIIDDTYDNDVRKWIARFKEMSPSMQTQALSCLVTCCSVPQVKQLQSTIEPLFQKDFIRDLPTELALLILGVLPAKDLANVSQVCKYWLRLAEEDSLWKKICKEKNLAVEASCHRWDGAWTDPADIQEIDFFARNSNNNLLSSFRNYNQWMSSKSLYSINAMESCLKRAKWKALYLRHQRIRSNWRSRPIRKLCILKCHEEHVITCLLIRGDTIVTGSDDNSLKIWSASEAVCLYNLVGHTGGVWSSQISECGKFVVSGSTDRTIRIWCTETGRCLHELEGHSSTVRCLSLKEDFVASGSRDTTIRLWNIRTGKCLKIFRGHVAAVRCVEFDGVRIVSGSYDYSIKVWDAATGNCIHTLTGHTNRVYSLLFDSDRDIVVSGSLDTTIRVWNISQGICVHTLVGHQSLTSGMQLRGNILVSGNADSTIKVWDIIEGQCKTTFCGANRHSSAVTSLQFLDHGLVASSSDDGSVKLWDVEKGLFVRDLMKLYSGGSGGCIWRLKSTPTMLICAVGSRNGTEDTKLVMMNFDSRYP